MSKVLDGRYQLIAQLGGGGMADVFLAKLVGSAFFFQKLAVVKRLKRDLGGDGDFESMFRDEARLCALLNHPNIVQAFEIGQDADGPFLVMEYLEGQSLARIRTRARERNVTVPLSVLLQVLAETLAALHYAHGVADHEGNQLSVVHRDVSPQNIVVTYSGATKLVDFGVAKNASAASETRAGTLKGKIVYMAPEQARLGNDIDARADVFSAGLIMWEMLTGKRVWDGAKEVQVLPALLDANPIPSPRSVAPEVSPELDAICVKAISKNAEHRYASAAALLDAIEGAVAKLDLRATPREVAQVVTSLFAEDREKLRGVISAAAERATSLSLLPSIAPPRSEGSTGSSLAFPLPAATGFSSPSPRSIATTPNLTTARGVVESMPGDLNAPPKTWSKWLALLAVGGVAAVATVLWLLRGGAPPATTPAVIAPPAPIASALPAPAEEVVTEIAVTPASARLFIDGKSRSNPLQLRTLRSTEDHDLRAEADGFEPKSVTLTFDRHRSLEISLVAKAKATHLAPAPPVKAPPVFVGARGTSPAPASTPPASSQPPARAGGISEIDTKRSPTKPAIDTDVFKR